MRILKRHGANIASTIIVAYCAALYFKTNVLTPIHGLRSQSDFAVYYRAAQDIVAGKSPYENPAFFYPPLVAFLMTPFALTDYVTGRWIWFVVSHVCLLAAAWLLWRGSGRGRIALCSIACVWALGGAAKETFDVGQLSPLLVIALVIAYTQRARLQGAAIGIGFALKYIPGVLAVALLLHRRARALVPLAMVSALGLVIPWAVLFWAFQGAKIPGSAHYWMGTPAMFSWSIPSMVLRALDQPIRGSALPRDWEFGNVAAELHLSPALRYLSAGAAVVTLVVGMVVLVLACRGRLSRDQAPWAMAGLVSLSLAAAPVCWTHYQVLQYPGVALLLVSSLRLRAWHVTAAVALCFALCYRLPEAALIAYHDQHGGWTAASPVLLYVWTSVAPLACLGLFGLSVWNVRRGCRKMSRGMDMSWREPRGLLEVVAANEAGTQPVSWREANEAIDK